MATAPAPRKILVAVDGSAPSMRAAWVSIGLARLRKSPLRAVFVMDVPRVPLEFVRIQRAYVQKFADRTLKRVAAAASRAGVPVETRVREGRAAAEIAREAVRCRADLLVVGSRGFSALNRMLLGSVSGALVQQTGTSVLVVK